MLNDLEFFSNLEQKTAYGFPLGLLMFYLFDIIIRNIESYYQE